MRLRTDLEVVPESGVIYDDSIGNVTSDWCLRDNHLKPLVIKKFMDHERRLVGWKSKGDAMKVMLQHKDLRKWLGADNVHQICNRWGLESVESGAGTEDDSPHADDTREVNDALPVVGNRRPVVLDGATQVSCPRPRT